MARNKRSATIADLDSSMMENGDAEAPATGLLLELRNMWEFASLMQWIFLFGSVVKIEEDFDIEDLENECMQTTPSDRLASIGLAMLKLISSHRGLTPQIFAEYARRQYLAKAPARNPFGDEEDPIPFNDLDIKTRVRVLQQLSTWTFTNDTRMRGMMPADEDDLNWRIEPLGWDADDSAYFVLDDNRLYRRTDEPLPPTPTKPKPKQKPLPKKKRKAAPQPPRGTRTSKRLKISEEPEDEEDEDEDEPMQDVDEEEPITNGHNVDEADQEEPGYGFTSKTWSLIAITLEEYNTFLDSIRKTRDANEKTLRRRIVEEVLPVIEKRAEAHRQKQLKKLRELENLQKMATAKRSSRLAGKAEKQAQEDEVRREEERKAAELRMAHEEQLKQQRIEQGHESRRLTREQRVKDREVKRILHEEELARLEREGSSAASAQDESGTPGPGIDRKRLSSRNLQSQKEAHAKELARLAQDQQEDAWYFDCIVCGMHGENLDDGSHSVACERCNVWQHSACHGFTPQQCESDDFHFICSSCRKEEQQAQEQRSGLTLKLGKRPQTESPNDTITIPAQRAQEGLPMQEPTVKSEGTALPDFVQQQLNSIAARHSPTNVKDEPLAFNPQNHAYQRPKPRTTHPIPGYTPNSAHMAQHTQSHQAGLTGVLMPSHEMHWQQTMPNARPPQPANASNSPIMSAPLPNQTNATPRQASASPTLPRPEMRVYGLNGNAHPQPHLHPQLSQSPQPTFVPRPFTAATPQHGMGSTFNRATAIPSSPGTALLPPKQDERQAAISPTKSSPPRAPATMSPPTHAVNGHATGATPNGSFEHIPRLETPSKTGDVAVVPPSQAEGVAEHGMQGPWPNGALSVPKKNDAPA